VINASWHVALGDQTQLTLQDAIDIAFQNKCLVVAAAGNDGTDNHEYPTYPADYDHVLAVAATDRYGSKASFSNYSHDWVDIAAPGMQIVTTGAYWIGPARYPSYSGTSAAAAFVSSGAALIVALNPTWGVDEVAQHLKDSADKVPGLVQVCVEGNRLNLGRAVYGPIHVTAPAAGDMLHVGQQTTITWTNDYKSARLDKVKIELSTNGGTSWGITPLVASTPNDGKWKWTPTAGQKTNNGRIRITPVDGNFPALSGKFKVVV
jgi:subtilisin family serine protease